MFNRKSLIWNFLIILIAVALLAGGYFFISSRKNNFLFVKEKVYIKITNEKVTVNGFYFYRNDNKSSYTPHLVYNFPVDENHPFPSFITVDMRNSEGSIPLPLEFISDKKSSITVELPSFEPGEERIIFVNYEQPVKAKNGRYILTNIKKWNKPLESAEIIIEVPPGIELSNFSYKGAQMKKEENYTNYILNFKNFYPEEDLEFSWR